MSFYPRTTVVAVALAVVAFGVYAPGLSGAFFFDDYPHIVDNPLLSIGHHPSAAEIARAMLSSSAGPLKRPISMLSFGINHYLAGLDPFWYKLTNIAIHLGNGLLIGFLAALLLKAHRRCLGGDQPSMYDPWVATGVAAIWLLHPLNVTSVLYVVQRMTSLSSMFVLCGLIAFVHTRLCLLDGKPRLRRLYISTFGFGGLAVLSKETGILMLSYALAVELALFRFHAAGVSVKRGVIAYFLLFVFLPVIALLGLIAAEPGWITGGYVGRAFSLHERVLTEARVLWEYLRVIAVPDLTRMALHHDDFALSRGLLDPPSTLAALIGHAALVVIAWRVRQGAPLVTLAILWFYLGHVLESSVFPLEIMHEHRNYLPMCGMLLACSYYLFGSVGLPRHRRLKILLGMTFAAMCAVLTAARSAQYGDYWGFPLAEAAKHATSARANYEAGRTLIILMDQEEANRNVYGEDAEQFLRRAMLADPSELAAPLALMRLQGINDRPIPRELLDDLSQRLQFAPPPNSMSALFRSFYHQLKNGQVRLERRQVEQVFDAALSNPKLHGDKRAHVLTALALTYLNVFRESGPAIGLLRAAAEAAPSNPEFLVVLAAALLSTGAVADAAQTLDEAERLDPHGYMREDIVTIRQAVSTSDGR